MPARIFGSFIVVEPKTDAIQASVFVLQCVNSLLKFGMKSIKQYSQEIKALAKKGDRESINTAREKTLAALKVHPHSETLLALFELLT